MEKFDVFLCHNSKDKPAVIQVAEQLKQRELEPWLDIWELRPGFSWQDSLEQQINQIGAVAIFVGSSGFGPWQSQEINAFLRQFVNRKCPVIPVLLSDAPTEPQLPLFLQGLMWVDFRSSQPDPMGQLIWGITGLKPGTRPTIQPKPPETSPKLIKTNDLASEKGIDYTKLRDLLAAHKWKEADIETYLMMMQAVGKKDGGWFSTDELLNFPCTDLRKIDQLWVKYSNGKFGFSVQKKIYLGVGGKADGKYYEEAWNKFGDKVGWRRGWILNKEWISYSEGTFDTSAPVAHLPMRASWRKSIEFELGWASGIWVTDAMSSLASRVVNCNI
ncbi:GUN4 domain-containing protein [Nostoc sp.]|uniref:GUN4 domain-containing protein n=1 Tax=Nostoc sp. TaxID=1180 RepID=UPI0035946F8E